MEYNSAFTKKKILLFVTTWMSLEDFMLSEISQTEKQILYDLIYGIYNFKPMKQGMEW